MFLLLLGALILFGSSALADITSNFISPIEGSYYQPFGNVFVQVTVSSQATNTVNVYQKCGETVTTSPDLSPTGTTYSVNMRLPSLFTGTCVFTAIFSTGETTVSPPPPVSINVRKRIVFNSPDEDSDLYAGAPGTVSLSYTPDAESYLSFLVQLDCPNSGLQPFVQSVLANNDDQAFNVPSNYYGSSSCTLSVPDIYPEYHSYINPTVNVIQILFLGSPKQGQTVYIGIPFDLMISSDYTIKPIGTATATILDPTFTYNDVGTYEINQKYSKTLSNDFFGTCTVNISTSAPNAEAPAQSPTIKVMYGLRMSLPLPVVVPDYPFSVELISSAPLGAGIPIEIDLYMKCADGFSHIWPSVAINNLVQLSPITAVIGYHPNCVISTDPSSQYFGVAKSHVTLMYIPTGGAAYPMTKEQQLEFLASILIPSFGVN